MSHPDRDAPLRYRRSLYEKLKRADLWSPRRCMKGMRTFIDTLELPEAVKVELKKLTPASFIGDAQRLVDLLK